MLRQFERYTPGSKLDLLFGLWSKVNDSLNKAVSMIDQKMLTVTSCNTREHFEFLGHLSVKGRHDYWNEIHELLREFDRGNIKLLLTPTHNVKPTFKSSFHKRKNRDDCYHRHHDRDNYHHASHSRRY